MSVTTATTWPTQISLPGQAAAPDGPIDMGLMYVMHHAFRRDLEAFAAAVPATPVEATSTWRALVRRWGRLALVLHNHHSGEDAGLWPELLARADAAGDTGARRTLEEMEAEHATIDPLLAACEQGLARMAAGGNRDDRAALSVRVAATRDALSRHLAHEESEAIAIMQRYLTAQDWHRIDEEHFKPALGPRELSFVVPWACLGVPEPERARMLADAGIGFRALGVLTRPGFLRLERAAFAFRP